MDQRLMYVAQKQWARAHQIINTSEDAEELAIGAELRMQAEYYMMGLEGKVPVRWSTWAKRFGEEYDKLMMNSLDPEYRRYMELRQKYEDI